MTQQNTQAVVLQQPNDQKLVVKIEQDPDWISIGALFVSFLAFVVTIYVVKKSSESQIKSNIELIKSQEKLRTLELFVLQNKVWIDEVIKIKDELDYLINTWSATLVLLNSRVKKHGEVVSKDIFKESNDQIEIILKSLIKIESLIIYLDIHDDEYSGLFKDLKEKILSIINAFNEQTDCESLGRDFFKLNMSLMNKLNQDLKKVFIKKAA